MSTYMYICIYVHTSMCLYMYVGEGNRNQHVCFSSPPMLLTSLQIQVAEGADLRSPPRSAATLHCYASVLQEQMNMSSSEKPSALLFKARVLLITCSQLVNNSKISSQP